MGKCIGGTVHNYQLVDGRYVCSRPGCGFESPFIPALEGKLRCKKCGLICKDGVEAGDHLQNTKHNDWELL